MPKKSRSGKKFKTENNSLVSFDVAQIPDAPSVKTNEM